MSSKDNYCYNVGQNSYVRHGEKFKNYAKHGISKVVGLLLAIKAEGLAFVVASLYLIFEYNRPHMIYPIIDVIPWGKTLLFGGTVLAFMEVGNLNLKRLNSLFLYSAVLVLSIIFGFSIQVSLDNWQAFFSWLIVIVMITTIVNSKQRLLLYMAVYFLCNLKMAQHGFRTWATRGFGFSGWGVTGSPGWFQNSGEFGMEMAVFLPFIIAYVSSFKERWSPSLRIFFYLLIICVVGSIIASSSRGALVSLGIIGIWWMGYAKRKFKTAIVAAGIAWGILMVIPPEFMARFETAGEDKTSLTRLAYWEVGRQVIREHPLLGVGFRNWTYYVAANHPELKGAKGWGDDVEVIHNSFLEVGTELGLSGLFAYLIMLVNIYVLNKRSSEAASKIEDKFLVATAKGLNGSLMAYIVPSYFMSVVYYPYIWIMLALTVSLSLICSKELAQAASSEEYA